MELLDWNAAAYWFGSVDTKAIIVPKDKLKLKGLRIVNRGPCDTVRFLGELVKISH